MTMVPMNSPGTSASYFTVTVATISAKALTAFSFQGLSPAVSGTITEATHTIGVTVPYGTNVSALVASFTTSGASVKVGSTTQVSGTTPNNFTSPVTYTVTAADASTQAYTVAVTVAAAPIPAPAPTPTPVPAPAPTPTPVPAPTVTLKLSGLKSGTVALGRSLTVQGSVSTSLAGSRIMLTAQLKKGAKWVKAKTFSALINSAGTYSWKYKPAKKGAYRVQGSIAKTATHAAVTTKWLAFKVK